MKSYDVRVAIGSATGTQVFRVKAKSAQAALNSVRTRGKAFANAECVDEEIEIQSLETESVTLDDISEVEES